LSPDPDQSSFKAALVAIVFASVWFESASHVLMAQLHGVREAKNLDRVSYKEKLQSVGCSDGDLLNRAERLQQARKEIVHEKAFLDRTGFRVAQTEAANAHELVAALSDESGRMVLPKAP
jgi:hypothetical protein